LIAMLATLACSAALPSAAQAGSTPDAVGDALSTVQTTVAEATAPARQAAQGAGDTAQPASGGIQRPGGHDGGHPVQETIAPIAQTATSSVPVEATTARSRTRLHEHARHQVSNIGATASGERMSSGRTAHRHGSYGSARRAAGERSAPANRPALAAMDTGVAQHAAAAPASIERAPSSGAPGAAASGSSGGLASGGGGFALLVATLLLAGPCLRRRLALLAAVCRPVAFLVVLERPG
jgi:hypothetical protein